jgi:uncharacterized protein YjbI with pentapeptide repeats
MANEEQLSQLKKAIAAKDMTIWNRWRGENPDSVPELTGVKLSRADLNGANLSRANLSRANLFGAKLKESDLTKSNLIGAYFNGTDLRNSRLSEADLTEAFLIDANLTQADLTRANLSHAKLTEANLNEANFTEANLSGADLSRADLTSAKFSGADLTDAKVTDANLMGTDLISKNENKGFDKGSYLLESHRKMAQEVRFWSGWSLAWGVIEIILSALNSLFGLMLIVVSLFAGSVLNTAAMFIVFGVIFLWTATVNLLVGGAGPITAAIILVIFAVRAFLRYARYRPVEAMLLADYRSSGKEQTAVSGTIRSERLLPWLSFLTALLSLFGLPFCLFVAGISMGLKGFEKPPTLLFFVAVGFIELSVLALALGLAAILSRYRHKALSIVGILGGAIPVLMLLFFLHFSR